MRGSSKTPNNGVERYVLAVALLILLGVALLAIAQLPGVRLSALGTLMHADARPNDVVARSRVATQTAPPPTLAPAASMPTARPTATASTPVETATAETQRTYTVKPGDELKHIAAEYGVSVWRIIETNDIPDPDDLRVGQVLRIPDG